MSTSGTPTQDLEHELSQSGNSDTDAPKQLGCLSAKPETEAATADRDANEKINEAVGVVKNIDVVLAAIGTDGIYL